MKIEYGISEVRSYKITRACSDDREGSLECFGEFTNLAAAERTAELLSRAESGSTWYTVPKPE